jgi:BlaI family transcriptional regulator, penicillinase repressor
VPPRPQAVTDAELGLMKLIWQHQPVTAGFIRERLYPAGSASDHATVQKLLKRLEQKRIIRRDRDATPHSFRALVSCEQLAARQLDALADRLTEGSLVPFIIHAVGSTRLSAKERAEILEILRRGKAK